MNRRTALKILFLVIISFFVLDKVSLAQNVETSVTVGTDTFSQLSLSPQSVEIAERSEVLITAYNGDGSPKINRDIEIYVDGNPTSVFIVTTLLQLIQMGKQVAKLVLLLPVLIGFVVEIYSEGYLLISSSVRCCMLHL